VRLVREVLLFEGVCCYDANVASHHHFRCNKCGNIEDIDWQQVEGISLKILTSLQTSLLLGERLSNTPFPAREGG
jgi:Fur family peroxide stress response transcriptional regulator